MCRIVRQSRIAWKKCYTGGNEVKKYFEPPYLLLSGLGNS